MGILLDVVTEYAQHFGVIVKSSMIYQKSLIPILIALIVETVSDLICTFWGDCKVFDDLSEVINSHINCAYCGDCF